MNNLTLLIPAKEEAESLPLVLKELEKYNCRKLVVMSKEDKDTIKAIEDYSCEKLYQKKNGYGAALIEGIEHIETEYLCIFNADGSFNPIYLNEMLNMSKSNYDFIFSSRYSLGGKTEDDTILTFVGNKIFTLLGNIFFKLSIGDILYTFVLGRTKSFKKLNLKKVDFRICVELPIKANRSSMRYTNMGSHERRRFKGFKKVNEFKDGFLILVELINLFISRKP